MATAKSQARILTDALKVFFLDALKVAARNPAQAYSFFRTAMWQAGAARLRSRFKAEGVHVPSIAIFSITNRCNLKCEGCYALAFQQSAEDELSDDKLESIITEAGELGVSFFVLSGGEPMLRPIILDIIKQFPQIIFLVFTNGLLIDAAVIGKLKKQKNTVPLISLEGNKEETDRIRGEGTFRRIEAVMKELREQKIFFGTSLTLTRQTFATITEDRYIARLAESGCKFFLFLEYSPVSEGTEDWTLTVEQWSRVRGLMESYRSRFPALFIAVPWDEEDVGGCLAAGRGFVHINAKGDIEPCPFAPFSDTNLRDLPLKEALKSRFLEELRQRPELLEETGGGCGLWKNREIVKSLLRDLNAGKEAEPAEAALVPEGDRS